MRSNISIKLFSVMGFAAATSVVTAIAPAAATEVDISGGPTGNGCTVCFGGPTVLSLGETVTLDNEGAAPLQRTLGAGTYSITNAATSGNFSAFRYDAGASDWAWNFVIGTDNGNNTANVLDVGWVDAPFPSQSAVAGATNVATYRFDTVLDPHGSTAGYSDTLTLTATTTLDFFVVDGFLSDNIGGVALEINPVSAGSTPEPSTWAMLLLGFAGLGFAGFRRQRFLARSA
jgi:PEP-CTERM motif